jgi:glycosyltransferase involved in cell wall biosynthesis
VPSRREGYGMTAREAMAYGRPVVATRVGGLADLGDAAVLVDVGGLRAAVEVLLHDRELRWRMGSAARERALEQFSTDAAAVALERVYRRIL